MSRVRRLYFMPRKNARSKNGKINVAKRKRERKAGDQPVLESNDEVSLCGRADVWVSRVTCAIACARMLLLTAQHRSLPRAGFGVQPRCYGRRGADW